MRERNRGDSDVVGADTHRRRNHVRPSVMSPPPSSASRAAAPVDPDVSFRIATRECGPPAGSAGRAERQPDSERDPLACRPRTRPPVRAGADDHALVREAPRDLRERRRRGAAADGQLRIAALGAREE